MCHAKKGFCARWCIDDWEDGAISQFCTRSKGHEHKARRLMFVLGATLPPPPITSHHPTPTLTTPLILFIMCNLTALTMNLITTPFDGYSQAWILLPPPRSSDTLPRRHLLPPGQRGGHHLRLPTAAGPPPGISSHCCALLSCILVIDTFKLMSGEKYLSELGRQLWNACGVLDILSVAAIQCPKDERKGEGGGVGVAGHNNLSSPLLLTCVC